MIEPKVVPLRATNGIEDWRALLADPVRQWKPGYSAMATARSWEAGFPPEVARLLGNDVHLQLAIVEHKVEMPGKGGPAQCDVFALAHADGRDIALAVEAKVEEPFDKTLSEWNAANGANKQHRLDTISGWLGLDRPAPHLRYQLLSRSAAAVAEARRFRRPVAAMIVQSFSPKRTWFDDFAAFCAAMGMGQAEPDRALETVLPDGTVFRAGWASGDTRHLEKV